MPQNRRTALLVAAALALVGCSTPSDPGASRPAEQAGSTPAAVEPGGPPTATSPTLPQTQSTGPVTVGEPSEITTGLEAPWSVAFVDGTALISERDSGRILELTEDGTTREIGSVSGLGQHSLARSEGGLLGLAVDEQNRLYAYSTAWNANRVQRFALEGEPGSFELGPAETILEGVPSRTYHNGGRIAFGPDGMLYVASGDAGDQPASQDLGSLSGKILRMTPDGDVPADNPFPDSLVYSLGHRNVQGLAWTEDGTMLATEFGQDTWDELNIIVPGGNYGWPDVEGTAGQEGFIDPVQQWPPAEASPSGLAVIEGTLVIANLRGSSIRTVPVDDLSTSTVHFDDEFGRIRDVVPAPDGTLWFVTNNTDGRGTVREGDDRIVAVDVSR